MADIYPAQLDGIPLQIESLDDAFEKSIVRHDIPYRDGALLEDMGQKARTIRFRCYFWDDDGAEYTDANGTTTGGGNYTYNDHIELLNHLEKKDLFSLVHPQYGTVKGCVETVSVRHDDRQMLAEIDISFVENLRTPIEELVYEDVVTVTETAVLTAQDQQQAALKQELEDEGLDTDSPIDSTKSLMDQLKSGSIYLRDMTREFDAMIGKAEGTLNDVLQPVNSLIATVSYAANLPGRILGPITRAVERVAKLYNSIIGFPDRFARNLRFELDKLADSFEAFGGTSRGSQRATAIMVKHLRIASAQIVALQLSYALAADQQARMAVIAAEAVVAFDANGNYLAPDQAPTVATVNDLEAALDIARAMIQDAIDLSRGISGLQDMALALLNYVQSVKSTSDTVVSVTLVNPMPLHLVCLNYGLPYTTAERLLALNPTVINPNVAGGEVLIYVR